MSPLMLLLTAITVAFIGAVITSVVKGNASLERARVAHNDEAARRRRSRSAGRARADHDRDGRQQVGAPAPRPAIGARSAPEPRPSQPQPGARIRLDDGRFGTITHIAPAFGGQLRVHLEMDDGSHGHVHIPDPTPPPVAVRLAVVHDLHRPAPISAAPPATARLTAAPPPTQPAQPVQSAPNVSIGGFRLPITPTEGRS